MAEVIILSDSDESVFSVENDRVQNVNEVRKKSSLDCDSDDFEFPAVKFYHAADSDKRVDLENNINESCSFNIPSCTLKKDLFVTRENSKEYNVKKTLYGVSDSYDFTQNLNELNKKIESQKTTKFVAKKSKSQLIEERLKRQEQLIREKALKTIASKKSKSIQPGECMKFMEVVLDKGIENFGFITDITSTLLDANIKYSINKELISNSITWKRNIENSYVNETNEICTVVDIEKVNQILVLWNWDEAVTKVADGSFFGSISNIKASLSNYNIMIVIFGIEDYFTYKNQTKNSTKNRAKSKTQKTNTKSNCQFKNFPEILREDLEMCLNEIQIINKCSSRLINNSRDLALMVYQCTKAIAEQPYKLEKNTNLTSKFDWYVMGDNRNTVHVDKDGNGLKRLWQQQLCQFNLSSLEIAEAICSVYPCPVDLMQAYKNCTYDEGINLLRDILIRRAAGPLTTTRKVGPELSKKMYTMFTSKDGERLLS
ncbi:crossover junction endonuclease EME1 [Hylaeus anthracinus]|uniref:crossover junction endonuclease EME1 n=1 Tax=Hylaeus anthracinus TaxID=313031 RepID=UPI0023B97FF7|nr:crossover junction endonuclease EME1 [Hylaeus anthracinus]XP_054015756.1 crossover junction endonuclease EME1 [Hylaeus anthracinus]